MSKLAAAHPGKLGDMLYCLPTLKYIHEATGLTFDFFTSEYCLPAKRLFEYQSYIDSFQVSPDYVLDNFSCGGQPWYVPIPNEDKYTKTYQLGFRSVPDRSIHQFIAHQIGIHAALAIEYEYPELTSPDFDEPYICIAPRGKTTFKDLFNGVADRVSRAIIIGGKGDYTGHGEDYTGIDLLDTLSILSRAKAFVGLMSSQLVLANGFDIPRIAPHDNKSWDMRHVVQYHRNFYPINPTVEQILSLI